MNETWPKSVSQMDDRDHFPIHKLYDSHKGNIADALEILKIFVETYPEALRFPGLCCLFGAN